jgi:hypothetical protein
VGATRPSKQYVLVMQFKKKRQDPHSIVRSTTPKPLTPETRGGIDKTSYDNLAIILKTGVGALSQQRQP